MAARTSDVRLAIFVALAATVLFMSPSMAAQQDVDHTAWDILLKRFVKQGLVDYQALQVPPGGENYHGPLGPSENTPGWLLLADYRSLLKQADPAHLPSRQAQLAFWINTYNACVIKGVLDHYPIKSVKDVKGFFDKIRYRVAGESLTLNEIEAKGRALGDWRIHFTVVCASSSCPFLRSEAYVPDRLDEQLADQVKRFLADTSRGLRVDASAGTLWVSKIFKWYAKDFVPNGSVSVATLLPLISPFLDPASVQAIRQQTLTLQFLDYRWSLNITAGS